jgi:hypothetical protein
MLCNVNKLDTNENESATNFSSIAHGVLQLSLCSNNFVTNDKIKIEILYEVSLNRK